jgi:hypothetical protein
MPLFYFLSITGKVMHIIVFFICCYVSQSLADAVQIKVTNTAAKLPLILLEKLLKNFKTLRKFGGNRFHVIL